MEVIGALITFAVGLGGVLLGGFLASRNEKKARTERLLVEALNDAVTAIAEVAGGDSRGQQLYASAASRIALHASPELVAEFRRFQDCGSTVGADGQHRLVAVLQAARAELGLDEASTEDIAVLLFGRSGTRI